MVVCHSYYQNTNCLFIARHPSSYHFTLLATLLSYKPAFKPLSLLYESFIKVLQVYRARGTKILIPNTMNIEVETKQFLQFIKPTNISEYFQVHNSRWIFNKIRLVAEINVAMKITLYVVKWSQSISIRIAIYSY